MKKIYLDDVRFPPDDSWIIVRSADACINLLREIGGSGVVNLDGVVLSLDHDLGTEDDKTGEAVVRYLEEFYFWAHAKGQSIPRMTIVVHSSNPIGRMRMEQGIKNINDIIDQHR